MLLGRPANGIGDVRLARFISSAMTARFTLLLHSSSLFLVRKRANRGMRDRKRRCSDEGNQRERDL
jgi:hypothetical protein